MLVLDASVCIDMLLASSEPDALQRHTLVAPPLLWSEATSGIRELVFRELVAVDVAERALDRLREDRIERRMPEALYQEAYRIASRLGWAKAYDAEYVALSRLLDLPLLTRDARLRRGAGHLVTIVAPSELASLT